VDALAGSEPITRLAEDHDVSRKFVYQQADKAQQALDQAFAPVRNDQRVLFYLPVTKALLRQIVLGLILICHSSFRGVVEFLRDLLDYPLSLGSVANIVAAAVGREVRQVIGQVLDQERHPVPPAQRRRPGREQGEGLVGERERERDAGVQASAARPRRRQEPEVLAVPDEGEARVELVEVRQVARVPARRRPERQPEPDRD